MSLNAELWDTELRHGHFRLQSDDSKPVTIEVAGNELTSRFLPVISRAHGRTVGHLAEWTGTGREEALPPDPEALQEHPLVPAMHMANYLPAARQTRRGWLLLRVPPAILQHPRLWPPLPQELFATDKFAPGDVVLCLSVDAGQAPALRDFIAYHQELGFLVALDDFGRRHADVGVVLQARPNMVLLPAGHMHCLGAPSALPRLLPPLCKLLHEAGVMVAMTGLEDSRSLALALQSGADLVSGASCAEPLRIPATASPAGPGDPLDPALRTALQQILDGETFESACESLLSGPGVLRCYLLDGAGTQLSENLSPVGVRLDRRYWPLANALGASWSHREYFQLARSHPGQVMRTGAYLSLPDGGDCQTLAIASEASAQGLVLCCDIRPDTQADEYGR